MLYVVYIYILGILFKNRRVKDVFKKETKCCFRKIINNAGVIYDF